MTAQDPLPQPGDTPAAANEVEADGIPEELTPTTRPRVGDSFDPRKSFFPQGIAPEHLPAMGLAPERPKRRGLPLALVAIAVLLLGAAAAWDLLKDFAKKPPTAQTHAEGTVSKAAAPLPAEEQAPSAPGSVPQEAAASTGVPAAARSTVTHTHSTAGTTLPPTAPAAEAAPAPSVTAARARPPTPAPSRPATLPQASPQAPTKCDPALSALGLC